MGREYRLISADGHVIEPPDMWSKYLPKKFADRAPKLVKDEKGGDAWELVPGTPPMPLGLVTNAGPWGKRYEELEWYGSTYESIRKGAFEGKARIEEQDIDGVDAEVLFPSQRTMGAFMAQEDDDYHLAGLEAYNTWMHDEFMAADPDRLIGLAQMPGVDTPTAVKWLRDAKAAGYRGVIISAYPSGEADLSEEDDAFWEAAEEEQIPIHIHSGLRQAGQAQVRGFVPASRSFIRPADRPCRDGRTSRRCFAVHVEVHLLGHISTAFPGSRWSRSSAERVGSRTSSSTWTITTGGTGPGRSPHSRSSRASTSSRNWKATFIREPFAVATRHWIGVDNMMWSTDYPHHRHDWPYSRRIIEDSMGGVPEAERRRMLCDNALELYRLG